MLNNEAGEGMGISMDHIPEVSNIFITDEDNIYNSYCTILMLNLNYLNESEVDGCCFISPF